MDASCTEHVVAIRTIYSICRCLDNMLQKTMGPNGKSTLLNTPTGQILITNVGCTVLNCMNIGHPLGSMIIRSIASHHNYSGDSSKTFMLYLTSIFSGIAVHAEERLNIYEFEQRNSLLHAVQYIRSHLFSEVLLPALHRKCSVMDVCENRSETMTVMCNLINSHLCGGYTSAIRKHLSRLLVDLLCSGVTAFRNLSAEISSCIDNFNLLCVDVDCMPPTSSYVHAGVVIQRDFIDFFQSPAERHARFVLLHDLFIKDGCKGEVSCTYEANNMESLDKAFGWRSQCSTVLVDWLQKHNVNLIMSAGCIGNTLRTLCTNAGISMVQFVDKEDFERLKLLFHINALEFMSDLFEVESDNYIGCSEVCEAKIFGQKRFVCLELPHHNRQCTVEGLSTAEKLHAHECLKKQLVICGMSAGACQQIRLDLLHALKTLRLWLDCRLLETEAADCRAVHIAGGGSFELICYDALQDFMKQNALQLDGHMNICCEALSAAFLAVPLRLLHNSFKPKLATVIYIKERLRSSSTSGTNILGFDGCNGEQLKVDTTVIEPLMSKILVIEHVLELTEQLLRINSMIPAKDLMQKSLSKEEIVDI